VILLEVITGRPITSIHEVEIMKEQVMIRSPTPSIGPSSIVNYMAS